MVQVRLANQFSPISTNGYSTAVSKVFSDPSIQLDREVELAISQLTSPDLSLRLATLRKLTEGKRSDIAERFLDLVDPQLCSTGIDLIVAIGGTNLDNHIPKLASLINTVPRAVQERALWALQYISNLNENKETRENVAKVFEALPKDLKEIFGETLTQIRGYAKSENLSPAIRVLFQRLTEEIPLGKESEINNFLSSSNKDLRTAAILMLALRSPEKITVILNNHLKSNSSEEVSTAIRIIKEAQLTSYIDQIVELAKTSSNDIVSSLAQTTLVEMATNKKATNYIFNNLSRFTDKSFKDLILKIQKELPNAADLVFDKFSDKAKFSDEKLLFLAEQSLETEKILPKLIPLLKNSDTEFRSRALDVVANSTAILSEENRNLLIKELNSNQFDQESYNYIKSSVKYTPDDYYKNLTKNLITLDTAKQSSLFSKLNLIGTQSADEILMKVLKDDSLQTETRKLAWENLQRSSSLELQRELQLLVSNPEYAGFSVEYKGFLTNKDLAKAADSNDLKFRMIGYQLIGETKDSSKLDQLFNYIKEGNSAEIKLAKEVLGQFPYESYRDSLIRYFVKNYDEDYQNTSMRFLYALSLSATEQKTLHDSLMKVIAEGDPQTRYVKTTLIKALEESLGYKNLSPEIKVSFSNLAKEEDEDLQFQSSYHLANMNILSSIPNLIKYWGATNDENAKVALASSLQSLHLAKGKGLSFDQFILKNIPDNFNNVEEKQLFNYYKTLFRRAENLNIQYPILFSPDFLDQILQNREEFELALKTNSSMARFERSALIIHSPKDYNGAFTQGVPTLEETASEKNIGILYFESDSDNLKNMVAKLKKYYGEFDSITFTGHGAKNFLALSGENPEQSGFKFKDKNYLDTSDIGELAKTGIGDLLRVGGSIIINSCLGASGLSETINNAGMLKLLFPHRGSGYAMTIPGRLDKMSWDTNPRKNYLIPAFSSYGSNITYVF